MNSVSVNQNRRRSIIISIICSLLLGKVAMTAPPNWDDWDPTLGKPVPCFWDGVVVIYAITGEWKITDGNAKLPFELTFKKLAAVYGNIPVANDSFIKARADVGGLVAAIPGPPEPNTRVMVVLRKSKQGGGYEVPPFPLEFMPNKTAIFPVTGDPKPVTDQILKALKKLKPVKKS